MAEKMIGSLIYGEHDVPKKQRPWHQRIRVPLAIGILMVLTAVAAYRYANYREEGSVSEFLHELRDGRYDAAYARWDLDGGNYSMKQFIDDWGGGGYYGKALGSAEIQTSNANPKGTAIIVYVKMDGFKAPVPLLVNKETLKISFSPYSKYVKTQDSIS